MKTYKAIEQEVNHIRLKIYEETKMMDSNQRRKRLSEIVDAAQREFGFQRVASIGDSKER